MADPKAKQTLPPNWIIKESRRYPGKFYYANIKTAKTTWELPQSKAEAKAAFLLAKDNPKTKNAWKEVSKSGYKDAVSGSKQKCDPIKKAAAPMVPRVVLAFKKKTCQTQAPRKELSEQFEMLTKQKPVHETDPVLDVNCSGESQKNNNDDTSRDHKKKRKIIHQDAQTGNEATGNSDHASENRSHKISQVKSSTRKRSYMSSETQRDTSVHCDESNSLSESQRLKSPSLNRIKGLPSTPDKLSETKTVKASISSPSSGTTETAFIPKNTNQNRSHGPSVHQKKSASRLSADLHSTRKAKPYDKRQLSKTTLSGKKQSKIDSNRESTPYTRKSIPNQSPSTGHRDKKILSTRTEDVSGHDSVNRSSRDIFTSPKNVVPPAQPKPQPGPSVDAMEVDSENYGGFEKSTQLGLNKVRAALVNHQTDVVGNLTEWMVQTGSVASRPLHGNSESETKTLYVVIDTNIILGQLKYVDELKDEKFEDFGRPYLLIPWVVLQELDGLKNIKDSISLGLNVQLLARNSVQYLNRCLQSNHPRIIGQTPAESRELLSNIPIECNDDRILQCVLQYQEKYPKATIVLLTDDTNLQNKAMVMHLQVYNAKSLREWLTTTVVTSKLSPNKSPRKKAKQFADDILCELKSELKSPLAVVMETEMTAAYDHLWLAVVYRKPPWTMKDLLDCFSKHWIAVFGMFLSRQYQENVKFLIENYQPGKGYEVNVKSVLTVLTQALEFCEALVEHSSYGGVFEAPLLRIKGLIQICRDVAEGKREAADLATLEGRNHDNGDVTVLTDDMDSVQTSSNDMNGHERLIQTMQDKFQILWENILYCKECLESFLQSPVAGIDVAQRKEHVDFLGRLVRCLSTLDAAYLRVLLLGMEELEHHPQAFRELATALDALAVQTRIQPWEPVVPESLLLFCRSSQSRPLLENGYTQLQDFLVGLHNCWLILLPQEKEKLNL